jgi:hypothetical protein
MFCNRTPSEAIVFGSVTTQITVEDIHELRPFPAIGVDLF